jgi:hypothetical protein
VFFCKLKIKMNHLHSPLLLLVTTAAAATSAATSAPPRTILWDAAARGAPPGWRLGPRATAAADRSEYRNVRFCVLYMNFC